MKRFRVASALGVLVVLATVVVAWAYYTTVGEGTSAGSSVGSLTAPSISVPAASTGSHAITWTAQSSVSSGENNDIKYFVERKLNTGDFEEIASGNCDGPLDHGTTSCTDNVGTSGSYTYRVVAKFRTWTATSTEAGAVVVTLGGTAPAQPTSVSLSNGGGTGNAYINDANKGSLNVAVGLGTTSLATDTVHVTITDGTHTTTDKTAPATTGSGSVTVTGIDASGLDDGSVTIRATSSNATGTSPERTTAVTKDTVAAESSASSPQYANSSPITVNYTATDTGGSGVKEVELWARKGSSGAFALATTDTDPSSASFSFTPSDGQGTYEFYTRATDNAANYEGAPENADATTLFDTTKPTSSASSPDLTSGAITVSYTATDTGGSGVKEVELWVRKGTSGSFTLAQTDTDPSSPSFSFTPADGDGTYQFYTRARDNATNYEDEPGTPPDDSTVYDGTKPTSSAGTVANIYAEDTFTVPYTADDTPNAISNLDKVELYVDDPSAGTNYVLAATDSTPSASGESFTHNGATTDGTYSFYTIAYDDAGNVEDAPGVADATATRSTPSLRMASGTYTGTGADNRTIGDVGFQPDIVIVKGNNAQTSIMRTSSMSGDAAKPLTAATALTADTIQSLTATGFTVGTNARVNANGTTYNWIAFKAETGIVKVGSYSGNNGASQSITGLNFTPEYVAVLPAAGERAVQRYAGMARAFQFDADNGSTSQITSFDSGGFTVGSTAEVNDTGTYHYIAFNEVPGAIDTATYTGNNTDNRSVTGLGFQPEYVTVRSSKSTSGGTEGNHRPASVVGTDSMQYDGGGHIATGVKSLDADGFKVGTNDAVNENGTTYHYMAFKNTGGGCGVPGTYTLAATADTWVDQASPTSNFGGTNELKVRSKATNSNARGLVQFHSLLPTLPSGCTVSSAQLRVRAKTPVAGRTIEAYRADATWSETGVNWNIKPATAGAAATATTPAAAGFMTWAVGSQVQAGVNDGFVLRDQTEDHATGVEQIFDSREATAANRPQLIITLTN